MGYAHDSLSTQMEDRVYLMLAYRAFKCRIVLEHAVDHACLANPAASDQFALRIPIAD